MKKHNVAHGWHTEFLIFLFLDLMYEVEKQLYLLTSDNETIDNIYNMKLEKRQST